MAVPHTLVPHTLALTAILHVFKKAPQFSFETLSYQYMERHVNKTTEYKFLSENVCHQKNDQNSLFYCKAITKSFLDLSKADTHRERKLGRCLVRYANHRPHSTPGSKGNAQSLGQMKRLRRGWCTVLFHRTLLGRCVMGNRQCFSFFEIQKIKPKASWRDELLVHVKLSISVFFHGA